MGAYLAQTSLWIALAPFALFYGGAALNQLVLVVNHDKFPVMMNARQIAKHREMGDIKDGQGDMTDDIHCIMSKKTRLNLLGDIFDFQTEMDSPGDLMVQAGEFLKPYAIIIWMALAARRLREQA